MKEGSEEKQLGFESLNPLSALIHVNGLIGWLTLGRQGVAEGGRSLKVGHWGIYFVPDFHVLSGFPSPHPSSWVFSFTSNPEQWSWPSMD